MSKTNLSIFSRGDIVLADISLILKDLTRKQGMLRKSIKDNCELPGVYLKSKLSNKEKADALRELIGYDISEIVGKNKEKSFDYMRGLLEQKNIFVSLYMHNFSPQIIDKKLHFSGICIKDNKCPFIFIRAGDEDSSVEPWGRRLFTLALMLSCMTNGKFGAVTLDSRSRDLITDSQYQIAEEFLMPSEQFEFSKIHTLKDVKELATNYSVSPSAMTMRLFRLKIIEEYDKDTYLTILTEEFNEMISKKGGGRMPR